MDYFGYDNGMYNNPYMNVQIDFDPVKLVSLGFSQTEVNYLGNMIEMGCKVTPQALQQMGLNYEQSQRIRYMYAICTGKANIDTKEELIRHLKKMTNHAYKIGIQDLPVSRIKEIPRVAVVAGITREPYTIWNSKQYSGKGMLYVVTEVSSTKITVETSRKPQLAYKADMTIPEVLEIKGVRSNGKAVVSFYKNYCRLCNRFIIVATLRHPEYHHGMYELICAEGTKVYVYARTMGIREGVKYNGSTERVYSYGFFPGEIKEKLDRIASGIYTQLHGVNSEYEAGNQQFNTLDKVRQDTSLDDEIIE